MTKVIVFGTFDLLHPGHHYKLKKAKKYAEHLIVVVARDKTVLKVKRKKPIHNERERLKNLKELDYVDTAILGNHADKYKIIEHYNPDIICLGYDQSSFTKGLKVELAKRGLHPRIVKFRKAHNPNIHKTSILRKKLNLQEGF
jgi:FAD synthetase